MNVSNEEFKSDHYGTYCFGSAFLLTTDMPKKMYEISKRVKFVWIDYYYISGLLIRAQ